MRERRVIRGGAYEDVARSLRTAHRDRGEPEIRFWDTGFRVVVKRRKP